MGRHPRIRIEKLSDELALDLSRARESRVLAQGSTFLLLARPAEEMVCLSGVLWITLTGDRNDYFLRPCEFLRTFKRSRILVEPLAGSCEFAICRTGRSSLRAWSAGVRHAAGQFGTLEAITARTWHWLSSPEEYSGHGRKEPRSAGTDPADSGPRGGGSDAGDVFPGIRGGSFRNGRSVVR